MIILRKQKVFAAPAILNQVGQFAKNAWTGTKNGTQFGLGSVGNKVAIIGGAAAATLAAGKMIKNKKEKNAQAQAAQSQAPAGQPPVQ